VKKCRFYFNFRSPYSWIGGQWLKRFVDQTGIAVEYIPFWETDELSQAMISDLGGEHYYTPMSKAKHLYILQDIKRITKQLGLTIKWPPAPPDQHWEIPHLAYLWARRVDRGADFFQAILESRWCRGEDICDHRVVAAVAEQCGLDPSDVVSAHTRADVREEGAGELMKAFEDGVFGIPFFVHGYNKFWGIDRFDLFLRSLQSEHHETPSDLDFGQIHPYYETDHPGGCG
jgi:2-hydroxychromene-2-carboxylate isomerase